ncbi:hypothetical protein CG740_38805 [Streptomyces sp. CB01201]|nr:hypothetical protein CG740_38805 [Streptomyces sp. CB01201]
MLLDRHAARSPSSVGIVARPGPVDLGTDVDLSGPRIGMRHAESVRCLLRGGFVDGGHLRALLGGFEERADVLCSCRILQRVGVGAGVV